MRRSLNYGLCFLMVVLAGACIELPSEPLVGSSAALPIGASRSLELYAIRLDVSGFEQVINRDDILSLPKNVRENLWLFNLDVSGDGGAPRLFDNALQKLRALPLDSAGLSQAERNMIRLLTTTPDNAKLDGTPLAQLLDLAPKVGIASSEVLANSLGVGVEEAFLPTDDLVRALIEGVIHTHPNARFRMGAKSAQHPDGKIPVPVGHVPVTLEECASDLQSLAGRYGPIQQDGKYHPGFLVGKTHAKLVEDDFRIIVRANANALPFKGIDLSKGEVGSLSSIGKEGVQMFDFDDPQWLRIEGLIADPAVAEMTFQFVEHPKFLGAGDSPLPAPWGNSEVWKAPPWTLERIVAQAALYAFDGRDYHKSFQLGADPTPLFSVSIDDGWMRMETKGDIGAPPLPLYIWDLMNWVAQVRLHDGTDPKKPIAEGEANLRFTLRDVKVGVQREQIEAAVRRNIEQDPAGLVDVASMLIDQRSGAPDLYYYRPKANSVQVDQGDWLFFLDPDDQPKTGPLAAVQYAKRGFYADIDLSQKISTTVEVDGDSHHEKVRIQSGQVLYCGDDLGQTYQLFVEPKPSKSRIRLTVSRLR